MGEPPYRGLYIVLASSFLVIICFAKKALRAQTIFFFVQPLAIEEFPNEATIFHPARRRTPTSKNSSRVREARTLAHFSRFSDRAGTPHPPLCQPSGTEEMLNELRSCAGQYELSRRLAWLPRGKRGGAEVAPGHLKRVRRTPQRDSSRDYQAQSHGVRASQCFCQDGPASTTSRVAHSSAAASLGRGTCCIASLLPAPAWGLLFVVCTVFGRVIGFGRAKCA